ncbi:MAG TPA: glyoxalase superfamily protein [Sphingomicrobium sp.]|jgi:catechol 2,3-dioxygenase-like lactoylglutathione lyase family enzyme|nr:glyoxalase superfamily protein [Sphingomicrobium sp.]
MGTWYSRPVLFVSDVERSIRFYVDRLGFKETWRHEDKQDPFVGQVDRDGTELIFSSQWPDKIGRGLIFISLDPADVSAVRAELEKAGVELKSGWWGYPLMIVEDPDGNELYIPDNAENA